MIHYFLAGLAITVGLVVLLGVVVILGAIGWGLVSREGSYGDEIDPDATVLNWVAAIGFWLIAGGVLFGSIAYVAHSSDEDCSDKGGHLVTRGKVTECIVDVHLNDGESVIIK